MDIVKIIVIRDATDSAGTGGTEVVNRQREYANGTWTAIKDAFAAAYGQTHPKTGAAVTKERNVFLRVMGFIEDIFAGQAINAGRQSGEATAKAQSAATLNAATESGA